MTTQTVEFTAADEGCYVDGVRGVYAGEAVQELALAFGWDAWEAGLAGLHPANHEECGGSFHYERIREILPNFHGVADGMPGHSEDDHGALYDEHIDAAVDYLNSIPRPDGYSWSWNDGDFGFYFLYRTCECRKGIRPDPRRAGSQRRTS
jgi:hypothetical protein